MVLISVAKNIYLFYSRTIKLISRFLYAIISAGMVVLISFSGSLPTAAQGGNTFEVRVAISSDDAEESSSGYLYLTSSDLELVFDTEDNQKVGIRFNGITIPRGATITNAFIQFQVDETDSGDTNLIIEGEDVDNAATFISVAGNISSRPRTSASVAWTPVPWTVIGEQGPDQQTPDIASVVQEIVTRPGWSSGNSLAIIITGSGERTAESYDGVPTAAPLLHIEYTADNLRPGVNISEPVKNATFNEGYNITFSGTADDVEDGDLTASLSWESSIDGNIGTGGSFSRSDLSVGVHTITATATDSGGLTGFGSTTITVFADTPVLVGAGDIAYDGPRDEATAKLLDTIPGTVFTLGDNVYPDGTDAEFAAYYDPTWGRHIARTRPSVGNHEYGTLGASGYFNYFGAIAGDPDKGYYSYDVGDWHIIVLNSECSEVGGCDVNSPQSQWLQADLAANPRTCTLAYFHHPLFSSAFTSPSVQDFWALLYEAEADVVLNGHVHSYERFALQDPNGVADPERGIRQFVVGTGGPVGSFSGITEFAPNSEVRIGGTAGVLKLTLHPTSYDWEFIPVAGETLTDLGSADCVNSLSPTATPTISETATPTSSNTPTPTVMYTPTPTATFSPTTTETKTPTPTPPSERPSPTTTSPSQRPSPTSTSQTASGSSQIYLPMIDQH